MKNYDINIYPGVHKVKVTLQQWQYKGHIFYNMHGNCFGKTILDFDFDCETDFKSDCELRYEEDEDYYHAVLKDDNSDELEVEGTASDFNNMIVALEIVDFEKENETGLN